MTDLDVKLASLQEADSAFVRAYTLGCIHAHMRLGHQTYTGLVLERQLAEIKELVGLDAVLEVVGTHISRYGVRFVELLITTPMVNFSQSLEFAS